MSTRLQVVIDDEELDEIRRVARRQGLTVSEWVRQSLRQARRTTSGGSVANFGLAATSHPTCDR